MVSIDDQIRSVQREIRMREHKYPQWVAAGRMSPKQADDELNAMRAVLSTLFRVQRAPQADLFHRGGTDGHGV